MSDLDPISTLMAVLWVRLRALHGDQRGYSTEAVVVTAALATLAIAVTAVIAYKVMQQASNVATH
ncbi:MAG: hypothetical protein ACYDC2_11120 [Solirubrobacteraceae bacterium]